MCAVCRTRPLQVSGAGQEQTHYLAHVPGNPLSYHHRMEPVTHTATAGSCSSTLSAPPSYHRPAPSSPTQHSILPCCKQPQAAGCPIDTQLGLSVQAPTTLLWFSPVWIKPHRVLQHQKAAHRLEPQLHSHLSHPAPTRPMYHAQLPTHLPEREQQVTAENTPTKPALHPTQLCTCC
jgi:hypothetical protein